MAKNNTGKLNQASPAATSNTGALPRNEVAPLPQMPDLPALGADAQVQTGDRE